MSILIVKSLLIGTQLLRLSSLADIYYSFIFLEGDQVQEKIRHHGFNFFKRLTLKHVRKFIMNWCNLINLCWVHHLQ